MDRLAVTLLVLASLAGGCAAPGEATRVRLLVTTHPDPDALSPTQEGEPARNGTLVIRLVAPTEPTSKRADDGNASGRTAGASVQPDAAEAVPPGAVLDLPAGTAHAAFHMRLDDEGRTTFRLGGNVGRLVLEVDGGAPPGAARGCAYAPASSPTYVDAPTTDATVAVPYRVRCLAESSAAAS